jgi:hypothetical protein
MQFLRHSGQVTLIRWIGVVQKITFCVIPAKAGIHNVLILPTLMDTRLRGYDRFLTFGTAPICMIRVTRPEFASGESKDQCCLLPILTAQNLSGLRFSKKIGKGQLIKNMKKIQFQSLAFLKRVAPIR